MLHNMGRKNIIHIILHIWHELSPNTIYDLCHEYRHGLLSGTTGVETKIYVATNCPDHSNMAQVMCSCLQIQEPKEPKKKKHQKKNLTA